MLKEINPRVDELIKTPATKAPRIRKVIAASSIAIALFTTTFLTAGAAIIEHRSAASVESKFFTAIIDNREGYASSSARLEEAQVVVDEAVAVLNGSHGRVLNEDARSALMSKVLGARAAVHVAVSLNETALEVRKNALAQSDGTTDFYSGRLDILESLPLIPAISFDASGEIAAVNEAVAAWDAEQARIAAEAAAAEAARIAAEEEAARQSYSYSDDSYSDYSDGGGDGGGSSYESPTDRVNRIASTLPFYVPWTFGSCSNTGGAANGCYEFDNIVQITDRGLNRSDCKLRATLAHEWRHLQQHQNGELVFGNDGLVNRDWAESDAYAFGAQYGR